MIAPNIPGKRPAVPYKDCVFYQRRGYGVGQRDQGYLRHKEGEKPKTYIQWVPEGSPATEVRIHTVLFKSDQPATVFGGFMNDIRADSETMWPNAMIETGFYEVRRRAPWP
jgi:hypothetical protein